MLTDTKVKNLKSRTTKSGRYGEADSNGLTIYIYDKGSKTWVHRYRHNGKSQTMTLGHYPSMSLLDARQARDANKQLLNQGVNPKENKAQSITDSLTFNDVFLQWHSNKKDSWSANYSNDVKQRAECYLLPFIGDKLIGEVTTPDIRGVVA